MTARAWMPLAVAVVLAALASFGWWIYDRARADGLPDGILAASGRIEARDTRVAAATGGRVLRLLVQEGDFVHEGAVLVELDRRALAAAESGAQAAHAAALENVAAAARRLAALESQLGLARLEAERFRRLYDRDAAPRQAAERAEAALLQLENEVRAARAGRDLALRQVDAARAQHDATGVQLEETLVLAPVTGFVENVLVRRGEMAAPGMPLLRLADASEVTVRVYVPITAAQRLRTGLDVRAYVQGLGDRFFPGVVERIAGQAEFTPRDVHMPDDRETLVHAVKLRIPNPEGLLKDGFPADVYIRWDPGVPWPHRPPWQ